MGVGVGGVDLLMCVSNKGGGAGVCRPAYVRLPDKVLQRRIEAAVGD